MTYLINVLRCSVVPLLFYFFFFFSSRRRHTRSLCDWSSDVCSSDLAAAGFVLIRMNKSAPCSAPRISFSDRKSTRLNSSHTVISYAVFCLKKKITIILLVSPIVDTVEVIKTIIMLTTVHRTKDTARG